MQRYQRVPRIAYSTLCLVHPLTTPSAVDQPTHAPFRPPSRTRLGTQRVLGECVWLEQRSSYRIRVSYERAPREPATEATVSGELEAFRCRRVGIEPCARGMTPTLCTLLCAGILFELHDARLHWPTLVQGLERMDAEVRG